MTEHPESSTFLKFLDGELEAGAEQQFREHIESCSQCERRLEKLREEEAQLTEALQETTPPESVKQDVLEEIESEASGQEDRPIIFPFGEGTVSRVLQAAASLLILLAAGGLAYFQFWSRPPSRPTADMAEGQYALEQAREPAEPVPGPKSTERAEPASEAKSLEQAEPEKTGKKEQVEAASSAADQQQDRDGQKKESPAEPAEGAGEQQLAAAKKPDGAKDREAKKLTAMETTAAATGPVQEFYVIRHRKTSELLAELRRKHPGVEFTRRDSGVEVSAGERQPVEQALAALGKRDTVPETTRPGPDEQQYRLALNMEQEALSQPAETPAATDRLTEQRSAQLKSTARPQAESVSAAKQERAAGVRKQTERPEQVGFSRQKLKQANQRFRNLKQNAGDSNLAARAALHLARNLFRLGRPAAAVKEYENWQVLQKTSVELPEREQKLLNELNEKYHNYRLKQQGWRETGAVDWQLTEKEIIRGQKATGELPPPKRLLVAEESTSDTQFSLQVAVRKLLAESGGGLAFGTGTESDRSPARQFYTYSYSGQQGRELVKLHKPGSDTSQTIWSQEQAVEPGQWFTLRVKANGREVSFYFDGQLATTLILDQFPRGKKGLIFGPAGPTEFRYFSVNQQE